MTKKPRKYRVALTKEQWNMRLKWGVETSDILASVAIVVSLFALYVSFKQLWLQEGQYESQRKENQPIFDITTYNDKVSNDTIDDTEVLLIKNIGREALVIDFIQCETFY